MDIPDRIREKVDEKGGVERIVAAMPSDEQLETAARTFSALSDPARLKILKLLEGQPLCVCLIKEMVDMADSKLSYHLTILKDAGLIVMEKDGSWRIYELTEKARALL